jgi:predicted amidophosphoribosyltransferase
MTSGTTLSEAARTLRSAGAASVVGIVVARTP